MGEQHVRFDMLGNARTTGHPMPYRGPADSRTSRESAVLPPTRPPIYLEIGLILDGTWQSWQPAGGKGQGRQMW